MPDPVLLAMVQAKRKLQPDEELEENGFQARDLIPLAQSFVQSALWPLLLSLVLFAWRKELGSLLTTFHQKIAEPGSEFTSPLFGVKTMAPETVEAPSSVKI